MKCDEIHDLLVLSLDDMLTEKEKAAVEEHLSICPDCVAFQQELQVMMDLLQDLPVHDMPAGLEDAVFSRLKDEGIILKKDTVVAVRHGKSKKWFSYALVAAMAACLSIGIGVNKDKLFVAGDSGGTVDKQAMKEDIAASNINTDADSFRDQVITGNGQEADGNSAKGSDLLDNKQLSPVNQIEDNSGSKLKTNGTPAEKNETNEDILAPEYSIADEQAVSDERMLKYSATMEMPVTSTDSSVSDRWSVSMNSTETAVIDARMENNEVWVDDHQFRQAVDSISKNISEGAESTQSAIAVKADANGFIRLSEICSIMGFDSTVKIEEHEITLYPKN